jgi:hypothetical protein
MIMVDIETVIAQFVFYVDKDEHTACHPHGQAGNADDG